MEKEYWRYYRAIKKWNKGELSSRQVQFMAMYISGYKDFDINKLSRKNRATILKVYSTVIGLI